ncbi:MAG: HypC/HybG/HupF family hydrogenase formation chaperone [Acidimicrobiales bacterium]
MCTSRLHRVVGTPADGVVTVEDIGGGRHQVSLLALDPPEPVDGEWLVVHSGYAIGRVDAAEAEAVAAELSAGGRRDRGAGAGPVGPDREGSGP